MFLMSKLIFLDIGSIDLHVPYSILFKKIIIPFDSRKHSAFLFLPFLQLGIIRITLLETFQFSAYIEVPL
jgi:hypothetical protein